MSAIVQLYKNAYSGLSKETWFLSLVVLINRSGTMVIPFMSLYATKELGFSIIQAGVIMALFGVGSICGAFIGGRLTDKLGFQTVQLFALMGGGIIFIAISFLTTFTLLCIGCFVLSTINESFRPANSTAIAAYSLQENRTRSFSFNRLAINLGWAFGGAIGGFLASTDYKLIFWVDGISNISAAIMLMVVLPRKQFVKPILPSRHEDKQVNDSAYKDRKYLAFIFFTIIFAFCFFQIFTILPIYFIKVLHLSEYGYGSLMALSGIIIVIFEMVSIFHLEQKRNPMRFMSLGALLIGIAYALLNILSGNFIVAFIVIVIISIGEILSMPFMNSFWIARSSDHNRGQYAALYTMGWGIAQVSGPFSGGWVADHFGFSTLWWMMLAMMMVAAAGYYKLTANRSTSKQILDKLSFDIEK